MMSLYGALPLPLTTKPPKLNPGAIQQALLHHSCFSCLDLISSALMADDLPRSSKG